MKYRQTLEENKVMDRCTECGSELRDGSERCGKCGATVAGRTRRCPECGKRIPLKSVFCPFCGKMVWNDMAEDEPPQPENNDYTAPPTEDDTPTNPKITKLPHRQRKKRTGRNRIIATVLVVAMLCGAGYWLYDWGGGGDKTTNPHQTITGADTTHTDPERINVVDASAIYGSTLIHDNRIGDKSVQGPAAYALVGSRPIIIGINYFSGEKQRSFFKLTMLYKEDGRWHCGKEIVRYEDGNGIIEMDRDKLKIAGENIPRFVRIDGKNYFYFIYMTSPAEKPLGTAESCHLKLVLFNIESSDFIQLDYKCEPVMANGTALYYGSVTNKRETPEFDFLKGELDRLPIVYHPSPAEIEMAAPSNASHKWVNDNDSLIGLLRDGKQEVTLTLTRYNSPLFSRSEVDMDTRVSTETYIYYVTHGGTVFGYNHITKKFFIAYVDDRSARPQIEINSDGSLHVKAPSVDFDLDPNTGKATLN